MDKHKQELVEVEPAGHFGWWIITYKEGIENKQAVTWDELVALHKLLNSASFDFPKN